MREARGEWQDVVVQVRRGAKVGQAEVRLSPLHTPHGLMDADEVAMQSMLLTLENAPYACVVEDVEGFVHTRDPDDDDEYPWVDENGIVSSTAHMMAHGAIILAWRGPAGGGNG